MVTMNQALELPRNKSWFDSSGTFFKLHGKPPSTDQPEPRILSSDLSTCAKATKKQKETLYTNLFIYLFKLEKNPRILKKNLIFGIS
jgi:hypothetical protein